MTTITQTITALPTAPARTDDPATFITRADAMMAALPTMVTQENTWAGQANTVAGEVNTNATAAAVSAAGAASSASTAGAIMWVSGTTYAIGDARFSPITFFTYRRTTTGGGTTDPSTDTANWTSVIPSGGISATASITTSTSLTSASAGYQYIAMTVLGNSVTLPDATTVSIGSPKFYLDNTSGGYPVGIRNYSGTLLMAIAAGGTAFVSCQNISSAAGVWAITGTNLEPGLITIDNTFSSTYLMKALIPFVELDANKTIRFLQITSGFAAVAIDRATGAVGTPVTVSATASAVPCAAFMVTSTTAIVFYTGGTTGTLISRIISLSGATTLAMGTASSTLTAARVGVEDFSAAPKIAQLDTTLYLVSYATATGAGTTSVAAFQVSNGTTVTLGSAVNIIAANNCIDSTATYTLTTLTSFVTYKSGGGAPYTNSGVVVSVTNANPPVCTVATPASLTGVTSSVVTAPPTCKLSATKIMLLDNNNTAGSNIASVFTVSGGTTTTAGTAVSVETGLTTTPVFTMYEATRYNPILSPLTATTALFYYMQEANPYLSRVVVLSESAGVMSKGTIVYGSMNGNTANNTNLCAVMLPQGTTEFLAVRTNTPALTQQLQMPALVAHSISGTTIDVGGSMRITEFSISSPQPGSGSSSFPSARLSDGTTVLTTSNYDQGGYANNGLDACNLLVVKSNGFAINNKGYIKIPLMGNLRFPLSVSGKNITLLGRKSGSVVAADTWQMRLLNVEIV